MKIRKMHITTQQQRRIFQYLFAILLLVKDCLCLKNVELHIDPNVVERHNYSILHCIYDLENAELYSVKWYRGLHEFYRYVPSEHPTTKVFPFAGITVDVSHSNSTQVLLQNIEFNLSGNFSCEVTTDEQGFPTKTDTKSMLVVQLPEHPPTISVGREPLDYGDILRANCSSPPSKPPALLKFTLNNLMVARSEPLTPRQLQEVDWSDLMLELPLSEHHFSSGRLILNCEAQVADIYSRNATLELQSARNPIPERVSAVNSVGSLSTYIILQMIAFQVIFFYNNRINY